MLLLLDISVDEERIRLRVNVLHHDLKSIEASGFGDLHLATEPFDQVLVDNPIRRREEGQDVRDEESFVVVEPVVPVVQILGQIDLLGRPEGCLGLFIHLPDLDGHKGRDVSVTRYRLTRHVSTRPRSNLTSWYLMGKSTKR